VDKLDKLTMEFFVVFSAFAFFIMCPSMAGMDAVVFRLHGLNPYVAVSAGRILAILLIVLMEYIVINFGVQGVDAIMYSRASPGTS